MESEAKLLAVILAFLVIVGALRIWVARKVGRPPLAPKKKPHEVDEWRGDGSKR